MGEAKRRGDFESRKKEAIEKQKSTPIKIRAQNSGILGLYLAAIGAGIDPDFFREPRIKKCKIF